MIYKNLALFLWFLVTISAAGRENGASEQPLKSFEDEEMWYFLLAKALTFDESKSICEDKNTEMWDSNDPEQTRYVLKFLKEQLGLDIVLKIWTESSLPGQIITTGHAKLTHLNLVNGTFSTTVARTDEQNSVICVDTQQMEYYQDEANKKREAI